MAYFANLGQEVVNVEIGEDVVKTIHSVEVPIHEDCLTDRVAEHADSSGTGHFVRPPTIAWFCELM